MAPHSNILAWKIPWALEPGGPWCQKESDITEHSELREASNFLFKTPQYVHVGERNGNPLQCSCLENPRDREAWWAAVYGVTQTQT